MLPSGFARAGLPRRLSLRGTVNKGKRWTPGEDANIIAGKRPTDPGRFAASDSTTKVAPALSQMWQKTGGIYAKMAINPAALIEDGSQRDGFRICRENRRDFLLEA